MAEAVSIPPALRDDLLTDLLCTSPDRARIIAELLVRNPGGRLLIDLEADDGLRTRFEMELLSGGDAPSAEPLYRPRGRSTWFGDRAIARPTSEAPS